jgi:hypothetical protein
MSSRRPLHRRIESLEKQHLRDPIILQMPDGRIVTLPNRGGYLFNLALRVLAGDRTPEMELIAQSTSSFEPGGGHMLDIIRAFWPEPEADATDANSDERER